MKRLDELIDRVADTCIATDRVILTMHNSPLRDYAESSNSDRRDLLAELRGIRADLHGEAPHET